ncbi:helix-turn-helix domain-containing protein [Tenacibaculum ovolyticum]|uniref:helix-turn-helix domain-containing protein n=1 Tax=Tenacibaculum ovolyticum TaxID=104270 RepID=UPI003A5C1D5D
MNTNTNYLSKVINQHKNTTFSNYINRLRIDYIVEKLKTDSLLRKYTIKTIANEAGFKNTESFSKAFYKFTEIKPSYFIKELEKTNTKH